MTFASIFFALQLMFVNMQAIGLTMKFQCQMVYISVFYAHDKNKKKLLKGFHYKKNKASFDLEYSSFVAAVSTATPFISDDRWCQWMGSTYNPK